MTLKIAAICTQYFPLSHADVIITRWLDPHPRDAELGFAPRTQIASLYVAQRPLGDPPPDPTFVLSPGARSKLEFVPSYDISRLVSQTYGVPLFDTVRDALTLGGDRLAVDAVLLIGEHGDYPDNAFGQKLYPRKELFDEVIGVFRASGRVVPLFCDKHLSWNMAWAREMVETVRALNIPFLSGSSAPITGLTHDLALPPDPDLEQSFNLFYLHPEAYGIHGLEFLLAVIEQRRGGESGIGAIRAYTGEEVWAAMDRSEWSAELFGQTLAATELVQPGDVRANCRASNISPVAFVCDHLDGHRSTHIMLAGHLDDFVAGVVVRGEGRVRASGAAANVGWEGRFVHGFAALNREIENLFLTGVAPHPVERNLLATLTVATWMQQALPQPGETILTPHLHIAY
jgi:hypothetical protein